MWNGFPFADLLETTQCFPPNVKVIFNIFQSNVIRKLLNHSNDLFLSTHSKDYNENKIGNVPRSRRHHIYQLILHDNHLANLFTVDVFHHIRAFACEAFQLGGGKSTRHFEFVAELAIDL